MTKLKKKIKRALAAFLREELLEYIGYNHNIPFMSLPDRIEITKGLEFETLVMEQTIPINQGPMRFDEQPYELEDAIRECKRKFAEELMDHIHVDAQSLTREREFGRRSVRLYLTVQKKMEHYGNQ